MKPIAICAVAILLASGCSMTHGERLTVAYKTGVLARTLVERPDFCHAPVQQCKDDRRTDPDDPCMVLSR